MILTRRAALAGGLSAVGAGLLPGAGFAASPRGAGERAFDVLRGGTRIGHHLTRVRRDGDALTVETDIDLVVRVLGIAAYRYRLESREVWEGGALVSLDSFANDDGDEDRAQVRRTAEGLVSEGTHRGPLPERVATTTYWTPAFLDRPVWLSTQTGAPLDVTPRRIGTETVATAGGEVQATAWRSEGDLPVTMFYDEAGEWVGNAFDAGGTEARFVLTAGAAPLAGLWQA